MFCWSARQLHCFIADAGASTPERATAAVLLHSRLTRLTSTRFLLLFGFLHSIHHHIIFSYLPQSCVLECIFSMKPWIVVKKNHRVFGVNQRAGVLSLRGGYRCRPTYRGAGKRKRPNHPHPLPSSSPPCRRRRIAATAKSTAAGPRAWARGRRRTTAAPSHPSR